MIRIFVFVILIFFGISVNAQDPQFSQFYAAPLYLGPSFSGNTQNVRLTTNFRDQWPKLPGEFVTYAVSIDKYFEDFKSGLGAYIMHDRAGGGKYNYSTFAMQYAYNARITRELFFKPGLEVSYNQRNIDFYEIVFSDQINRTFDNGPVPSSIEAPPLERFHQFDFSTSILVYSLDYWGGASVNHLLSLHKSVTDNDYYTPLKVSFYGGAKFDLNNSGLRSRISEENLFFSFYFKRQSQLNQLDIGAYYQKKPFIIGLWYRGMPLFKETISQDAIAILLGFTYDDITFGYSYDFTISRLISVTGGSHEISIIYNIPQSQFKKKKKHVETPCPAF